MCLFLAVSCRPPAAEFLAPLAVPSNDPCALATDSAPVPERLSVGIAGIVDPAHAPNPTNDAERFVFRQVYETLVRLDCAGVLRPGLARGWRVTEDGRWAFTLRSNATFSDGTPVTARAVAASFPDASALTAESESVVVARVSSSTSAPLTFADPALAVTRTVAGQDWPIGSGAYVFDTSGGHVTVAPFAGAHRPVLVLRPAGGFDARDLLDAGVDLLISDDPAVLGYAATRAEFASIGLPWGRTYVLAVPGDAVPVDASVRAGLARDAVRVDARPAGAGWWSDAAPGPCGLEPPPGAPALPQASSSAAFLYPVDDGTARNLVGRLIALGIAGSAGPPRATGLGATEFSAAFGLGRGGAYVLPLPSVTLERCAALGALIARAPWLADGPARHLTPLVETRRRAIVRQGAAAFTVDWDGTLRAR